MYGGASIGRVQSVRFLCGPGRLEGVLGVRFGAVRCRRVVIALDKVAPGRLPVVASFTPGVDHPVGEQAVQLGELGADHAAVERADAGSGDADRCVRRRVSLEERGEEVVELGDRR